MTRSASTFVYAAIASSVLSLLAIQQLDWNAPAVSPQTSISVTKSVHQGAQVSPAPQIATR